MEDADTDAPPAIVWACHEESTIYAADLDGNRLKALFHRGYGSDAVAVDAKAAAMYCNITTYGPPDGYSICKVDLKTGEVSEFVVGLTHIVDIALDVGGEKLYWTCMPQGSVYRASLNGEHIEEFLSGLGRPDELAVDGQTGKIYWTEHDGGLVSRINRDDTERETILRGLTPPVMGLAIDSGRDRLYVSLPAQGEIIATKRDGTDRKVVLNGLREPDGVAVDPVRKRIYWTETGALKTAGLDGGDPKELILGKTPRYASVLLVPEIPNLLVSATNRD